MVLGALRAHLLARAAAHDLLLSPDAASAQRVADDLRDLANQPDPAHLWPLIQTVHLAPGCLRIVLTCSNLADRLGLLMDLLNPTETTFDCPFTLRRRGVETKLISGQTQHRPDPTLQQNLARAYAWVLALRGGQSLAQIAAREGRSESAIRSRLTLAFLAPQIQRAILGGTLSPHWSTDAILRLNLPTDWHRQISALGR